MDFATIDPVPALLDASFPMPLDEPFTTRQADAAGISRRTLGRLTGEGLLRRLLRGVYVAAQARDGILLRAHGLALIAPAYAVICDWTACWLFTGLLPPNQHLDVPPLAMFRHAGHNRLRNDLCKSGERTFAPGDLIVIEGLTVTSPLRTAWDLGRLASRDNAIVALDGLLRHGSFSRDELLAGVERFRRQRGVVQLRQLAPLTDARAESPGESVLRLRWLDLPSLPPPTPQVPILGPDGRELYRIDLGVEELRFGAEYDGEAWHPLDDTSHDDERRETLRERYMWTIKPVRRRNVFGVSRDVEAILYAGVREARAKMGRFRPAS